MHYPGVKPKSGCVDVFACMYACLYEHVMKRFELSHNCTNLWMYPDRDTAGDDASVFGNG